ncbi:MAG: hypothetical protein IJM42_02610 [Synergistes sp.]|nr:hypothetical protein [Synergistes sp.]
MAKERRAGRLLFALRSALLITITALLAGSCSAAQPQIRVAVTSPWLLEVASFIGGRQASVRSLSRWTTSGSEVPAARPRAGEIIIAFDMREAAKLKISANNKKLNVLYPKLALDEDERRAAFFDPAMLPSVAQETMKIIAGADGKNYSYYQRRLAEFQSRIDSTMGAGRHMLAGARILDLTGAQGIWVRSSVTGVVRPPDSVWKEWLNGGSAALKAALDEAARRGWLLLLDPWTPAVIRSAAVRYPNRLTLVPPHNNIDYFVFLHDIFTQIDNKLKAANAKAAPAKGKKRP